MKKILKISLYSFLTIIVGGFIFFYLFYQTYSPELDDIKINEKDLAYFNETYKDSRNSFLKEVEEAKHKFRNVSSQEFHIQSKVDTNLIMDVCYIPPQKDTSRLLVLISGTHGIEGYTGSAIQKMFLNEFLDEQMASDMGVLLIHAFNPYGFKFDRKTTEFNVDLNRNCGIDKSVFENNNPGYADLYKLLCPSGEVNKNSMGNQFFYLVAIWNILKESMSTLKQAALQGQYEFSEGIYYGGKDFTSQTQILQSILPEVFNDYKLIFAIDLHTGYGEWAKLHLFPNPEKNEDIKILTESLFTDQHIDWGDSEEFYTIVGDLSSYIKQVNPNAVTLCMPFEYGTMNSQTTFGSLHSIHKMILENQGFNNGFKNEKGEKKVLNDFRELYYPSSESWRSEVIRQSRDMLSLSLDMYLQMEPHP